MTALLDPQAAGRLAKVCGMLGSDHPGERANAALAADKLVRSLGLTWRDVIHISGAHVPKSDWRHMAKACRERAHCLTQKEFAFVSNMLLARFEPSEKQGKWLGDIYRRVCA